MPALKCKMYLYFLSLDVSPSFYPPLPLVCFSPKPEKKRKKNLTRFYKMCLIPCWFHFHEYLQTVYQCFHILFIYLSVRRTGRSTTVRNYTFYLCQFAFYGCFLSEKNHLLTKTHPHVHMY